MTRYLVLIPFPHVVEGELREYRRGSVESFEEWPEEGRAELLRGLLGNGTLEQLADDAPAPQAVAAAPFAYQHPSDDEPIDHA